MNTHDIEASYVRELTGARIAALKALIELLIVADDPTEKRRAATAILRIPSPTASAAHKARPHSPTPAAASPAPPSPTADTAPAPAPHPTCAPRDAIDSALDALLAADDDALRGVFFDADSPTSKSTRTPAAILIDAAGACSRSGKARAP